MFKTICSKLKSKPPSTLNKKGFSLIEIAIVIAILALLLGVLAPSLLKYVENSRIQKDASEMDEVVNAFQLAMSDSNTFDEAREYSITNNYITYTDSSAVYGAKFTDEEFWAPDGSAHAVTITFNPDENGNYTLAKGIVNDMTYGNGSVAQARTAEGVKQCYLSEMGTHKYLYNNVRRVIGETFDGKSATYAQSSYTVFLKFEIVSGMHRVTVHGEYNGTNLSEYCPAAIGSNTSEYDEAGAPKDNLPVKGTQQATYSSSDLNGGGESFSFDEHGNTITPTYKQCSEHKYEARSCECKWCGYEKPHTYTDSVLCDVCQKIDPNHVCSNWVNDKCTECGKSRVFDYKFPASGTEVRIDLGGGEFPSGEGVYSLNENAEQTQTFNYTGAVQTFTPQYTGFYFIEAWGGAGGKDATAGGAGGYVKAHIYLEAGKTIYVSCGGKGADCLYMNKIGEDTVGGWNGGARPGSNPSLSGYSGAGGGATSITTTLRGNGELINYKDYKNEVIMVAGGGAGGSSSTAGMGGTVLYAYTESSSSFPGEVVNNAPSNLLSGNFALGQNPGSEDGGGGGGGWVGGINGRDTNPSRSGGGGASFINTLQKCVPVELIPNNNPNAGKVTITYQADSVGLATPVRDGYKFVGWSLEGAGSVSSNLLGGTTIFHFTENKATLVAHWQKL